MFGDGDSRAVKKLKASIKFPDHFKQKVLTRNVKLSFIEKWLETTIEKVQKMEDERLVSFLVNFLEDNESPDPRMIQINLIPFVGDVNAAKVASRLWYEYASMLSPYCVPTETNHCARSLNKTGNFFCQRRSAEGYQKNSKRRKHPGSHRENQEVTAILTRGAIERDVVKETENATRIPGGITENATRIPGGMTENGIRETGEPTLKVTANPIGVPIIVIQRVA